ncbi:MAG TPA: flagellar assembly protein FliW [Acidimicrobiales bacterium]|nr:flagellar assembly protein FliW [Acidimicrobiales bacterium]
MSMTQTHTSDAVLGNQGLAPSLDKVVLEFATGLPGFPDDRRFVLENLGPALEPFCRMRSIDHPDICFTVVPPGTLVPDYTVEIDIESVERLGLTSAEDAVILAIVTLAMAPEPPKMNLLGPIVVNRHTRAAAQVVQHGSSYGVAVPLVAPEAGSAA